MSEGSFCHDATQLYEVKEEIMFTRARLHLDPSRLALSGHLHNVGVKIVTVDKLLTDASAIPRSQTTSKF